MYAPIRFDPRVKVMAGKLLADKKQAQFSYGGQAIIEGVMMRGPKDFAVAVRRANGEIVTTTENVEAKFGKLKWLNKPFLRGTLALIDSLALGIRALKYSADIAMADIENQEKGKNQAAETPGSEPKKSKINDVTIGFTMILGVALSFALFFFLPIVITKQIPNSLANWQRTAMEGAIKITMFFVYIVAISFLPDIRRVFQYHGAEHKTINSYEAKEELTVENVSKHTTVHPRCGTSFILVVLFTSILIFMLIIDHLPFGALANKSWISYPLRFVYKLVLMPFIAGLSYEVIRFAGKRKDSMLTKLMLGPGLLMQKITTREPDNGMLEVAIASLKGVLDSEKSREENTESASA